MKAKNGWTARRRQTRRNAYASLCAEINRRRGWGGGGVFHIKHDNKAKMKREKYENCAEPKPHVCVVGRGRSLGRTRNV